MKKRYYNPATHEWYTEGQSLTRRVNGTLFSGVPSVEQLTQWGFEEWVEPEPTPEQLLERAKQEKIATIEEYDSSDSVNGITVKIMDGETVVQEFDTWIDRDTRADYKNSLDAAELLGRTEVTPVFNGHPVTLSVQMAKVALAQVQLYANQCYCVTERHKAAIAALSTVQDVEDYDFTAGYPHRLTFEI